MNQTTTLSAYHPSGSRSIGLTSGVRPEQQPKTMTPEIPNTNDLANSLFSLSDPLTAFLAGEASLQNNDAYYYFLGVFSERTRTTLTATRDPIATALLDELAQLTRRLLKPHDRVPQDPWSLWLACGTLVNYLRAKHGVLSSGLPQLEVMAQCKWSGASGHEDIDTIIVKVTHYLATLYKYRR